MQHILVFLIVGSPADLRKHFAIKAFISYWIAKVYYFPLFPSFPSPCFTLSLYAASTIRFYHVIFWKWYIRWITLKEKGLEFFYAHSDQTWCNELEGGNIESCVCLAEIGQSKRGRGRGSTTSQVVWDLEPPATLVRGLGVRIPWPFDRVNFPQRRGYRWLGYVVWNGT